MATEVGRWGTWEELLLGGAVLRHGTRRWDAVAAELRSRALVPYSFTPEICKAMYEDLQQRYSGCKGWFEELRKRRMEELRQAIEQSEDSIGSLESRLETLKAESGDECHIGYGSSQTESPIPFQKSERLEPSSKEASKDGLSAGSFTHKTQTSWPTELQIPTSVPPGETVTNPEGSGSHGPEKSSCIEKTTLYGGQRGVNVRKRRGKRKRKDCTNDVKQGSFVESGCLDSPNLEASNSSPIAVSSVAHVDDCSRDLRSRLDDLMGIFRSVARSEHGSIFQQRLESQKRRRYKKMIRQHMDLETVRLRIITHFISSAKEVYRDLLLLANNALVFYSKGTAEHESALHLRGLVMKMLQQCYKVCSNKSASNLCSRSTIHNPQVKPRSACPGNGRRRSGKAVKTGNDVGLTSRGGQKSTDADSAAL